jgi:metallophosphoesterase superfamily enzyme
LEIRPTKEAAVRVLDEEWLLTAQRVAIHLPTATGVVADLHLGYDQARRRLGEAVPARDLGGFLEPLRRGLVLHGIRRLVVAGDLLEEGRSRSALTLVEEFMAWLAGAGIDLVAVVPGNHDRGLGEKSGLPLQREGATLGAWRVVHGDRPGNGGKVVQGHEHPWARWSARLGGPCYLVAADGLILPAYSPDAAGGNVIGETRWAGYRCCVIAGDEVLDFGLVGSLK